MFMYMYSRALYEGLSRQNPDCAILLGTIVNRTYG